MTCSHGLAVIVCLLEWCAANLRDEPRMERNSGLIARGPIRLSYALGVRILTVGFVCGGFVPHPPAFASASAQASTVGHTVTFESGETMSTSVTYAATVADFLRENNIVAGTRDYV